MCRLIGAISLWSFDSFTRLTALLCWWVVLWRVVVRQGIEAEVKEGEKGMPESIK
jgi:hypothetical protein